MTINNGSEIIQSRTYFLPIYLAHTHKPGHYEVQYMYNLSQTYTYAFIHCILPPLGADKQSRKQLLYRALIKVLRLLYSRPDLFVFPLFLFLSPSPP